MLAYAGKIIKPMGLGRPNHVTHSKPTFATVRNGKHSSSVVSIHVNDVNIVMELKKFKVLPSNSIDRIKPVAINIVDGEPVERPRHSKGFERAVEYCRKYNFDAFYVSTNATRRNPYNLVERRIAPSNRELAGIVLPHDHFGAHLDGQGRTVNPELADKTFAHAGNVLASI